MSTSLVLKAAGLYTQPNNLSEAPVGSLLEADNTILDREGIVQQRRGIKFFATPVVAVAATPSGTITYGTPSNASTVILTGLPSESGAVTFTKVASDPEENEFTDIDELTALIDALTDLSATNNGTVITLVVTTATATMNSATITGTSSYSALSITFSGGKGGEDGSQQLYNFRDKLIAYNAGTFSFQNSEGSASFTEVTGSYTVPYTENGVIRGIAPNQNFYLNTGEGVKRWEFSANALKTAGGIPALDGEADDDGTSGWMTDDTAVAYRMVWSFLDGSNTPIVGTVSQRVIFRNDTGNAVDVELTFTIPEGVTTATEYKIYRSAMSATAATTPDDELKLVITDTPTSGQITAGTFTVVDRTPDSLRGEDLYTNSGQQGLLQNNNIPPICSDFCVYKGYTLYANTTSQQRFSLSMLSVGGTDGVAAITSATATITVVDYNALTGAVLTVNGTALTEGVEWTAATDNDTTAASLESAVDAVTGISSTVTDAVITATVIAAGAAGNAFTLTTSDAVNLTISGATFSGGRDATTLTINVGANTFTLTGAAAENIVSDEFEVFTGGTPAENIDETARSLVRVINRTASNDFVYAVYNSGTEDLPGQIAIFERTIGSPAFTVSSNVLTCWTPILPADSSSDRSGNGIYYSKPDQPEAVPLVNKQTIGSANTDIQRIFVLKDSVLVYKPEGIFRLNGNTAPFAPTVLDNTIKLIGNNSAVLFNNSIYSLTNQYVVATNESGVSIRSRNIENELQELLNPEFFENIASNVAIFGVSYETDRKYILGITITDEDTDEDDVIYYVYNPITLAFNKWTFPVPMRHGIINSYDDRAYWIGEGNIYQERKDKSVEDYADLEYAMNIISVDDDVLEVADTSNLVVGTQVEQESSGLTAWITEIIDATTFTVDREEDWDIGTADFFTPIAVRFKYVPFHGGTPGIFKSFEEFTCFFENADFDLLNFSFNTDVYPVDESVPVIPQNLGGWGVLPFGTVPWGDSVKTLQPIRNYFTKNTFRARWINITVEYSQARTNFALEGLSIQYEAYSPRSR